MFAISQLNKAWKIASYNQIHSRQGEQGSNAIKIPSSEFNKASIDGEISQEQAFTPRRAGSFGGNLTSGENAHRDLDAGIFFRFTITIFLVSLCTHSHSCMCSAPGHPARSASGRSTQAADDAIRPLPVPRHVRRRCATSQAAS